MEETMEQVFGNVHYMVRIKPSNRAKENCELKIKKIIEKAMLDSLIGEERSGL